MKIAPPEERDPEDRFTERVKALGFKRWVLYDETLGVYLGAGFGLHFWSKLDPVGQPSAYTFESEEAALSPRFIWDTPLTSPRAVEVECDDGYYASSAAIEAAGLPGWDPRFP